MRILFFGDVMGRTGRDGLKQRLPELIERLRPDAVVVNAENSTSGFGLTLKMAHEYFDVGVDCLTLGNHAWAQRELMLAIDNEPRIIRPLNYPKGTPGSGSYIVALKDGRKLVVVNLMARLFMDPVLDDPFASAEELLKTSKLSGNMQIFVDFHGEATSEKMAMGHFLDGRVSAVVGTHTHIPTADEHILPKGTAYMTDAGMCGDYDGVIGIKKEAAIWSFTKRTPYVERKTPSEGEATLCGAFIETDDKTGLAAKIDAVRVGGALKETA